MRRTLQLYSFVVGPSYRADPLITLSVIQAISLERYKTLSGLFVVERGIPDRVKRHGVTVTTGELTVLGCYHPSQQNTFTGKLTTAMIDDVVGRAAGLVVSRP